jgi:hypothetical protein
LNFTPKSPSEIEEEKKARMQLMDPGPADFVVKTAEDTLSKTDSTEMIEMQVEVTDAHGNTKIIKDWLTPKMMEKMRNFCYGTGVSSLYDQGILTAEHCDGLSGRCLIAVEKGSADPKGGKYPDKNKIRDYIPTNGHTPAPVPKSPTAAVPQATAAMRKAQTAYKAKYPQTPRDELIEAWNQKVNKYFFGRKPELVSAAEWQKFAADGFEKPAPEAPFGETKEFEESDIPFDFAPTR